jgi:hypothetical protein
MKRVGKKVMEIVRRWWDDFMGYYDMVPDSEPDVGKKNSATSRGVRETPIRNAFLCRLDEETVTVEDPGPIITMGRVI